MALRMPVYLFPSFHLSLTDSFPFSVHLLCTHQTPQTPPPAVRTLIASYPVHMLPLTCQVRRTSLCSPPSQRAACRAVATAFPLAPLPASALAVLLLSTRACAAWRPRRPHCCSRATAVPVTRTRAPTGRQSAQCRVVVACAACHHCALATSHVRP